MHVHVMSQATYEPSDSCKSLPVGADRDQQER
jgi:hypothetical protein